MSDYAGVKEHFRLFEVTKGFESITDEDIDKELKRVYPVSSQVPCWKEKYIEAAKAGRREGQDEKRLW